MNYRIVGREHDYFVIMPDLKTAVSEMDRRNEQVSYVQRPYTVEQSKNPPAWAAVSPEIIQSIRVELEEERMRRCRDYGFCP